MQQRLYLARHAHALDFAPRDEDRPLSSKGLRQCERLANGLVGKDLIKVDTIWRSGLIRANETAAALAAGLELTVPTLEKSGLAPYDDPSSIAAQLNQLDESCLVVGHDPNLSRLASHLLVGDDRFQRVVFPKASILCLSRIRSGGQATPWQIEWHLNHKHFKEIAEPSD